MAYVIAQPCIGVKDTACVSVCPVDCIHPTKDDADFATDGDALHRSGRLHRLQPVRDECPVTAIFPKDELPAEWASFIERNANYFKK